MPLPIPVLIWAGSALLSAYGLKKGHKGYSDSKEAEKIAESAQSQHQRASSRLEAGRAEIARQAASYGRYLVRVSETTLAETKEMLEQLAKRTKHRHLKIPTGVDVSSMTIKEYSHRVLDPPRDAAAGLSAVTAGVGVGAGAYSLVGLLGTASTGTAISSLSGVAASNATLAWLGGGSLAAGGGGMAAGMVTLGGIVAAPALALGGFVMGGKGEKALTAAKRYASAVTRDIAAMEKIGDLLDRIGVRIDELDSLAKRLNRRARQALRKIDVDNFDPKDDDAVRQLTLTLQLVRALSEVIQTPIMDEEGVLTRSSARIQLEYRDLAGGAS